MPEVSTNDLFEMASLVHQRWTAEFDALKAVRSEKDDGSTDWHQFHLERLTRHTASESKWKALLSRISSSLPKL